MAHKTRNLIAVLAVVAATFVGVVASEAQVTIPELPPVATTPTQPPGPLPTRPPKATTSSVPDPPPTTQPPPEAPPATSPAPAPPPEPAPTTGIQPAPFTGILPEPSPPGSAPKTEIIGGRGAPSTTVAGAQQPGTAGAGPASLTPAQVDDILRGLQRTGANSTTALLEALRPLQDLGMTADEAAALGMGQFPVQGRAEWTDDWLAPRTGPPFHLHQGNDLFAAFDTPVRAPVDGTVRFGEDTLGGNAAYVTAPDGTYYYMAHLKSYATDLSGGQQVKQGRVVGFVGDSGNAKGGAPHVHFEIHPTGGAAVNPKPIIDGWVAAALARVPELLARFRPAPAATSEPGDGDGGIPQVLVATGLTRRFSTPTRPSVPPEPPAEAWARAVLTPVTPQVLSPLLDRTGS